MLWAVAIVSSAWWGLPLAWENLQVATCSLLRANIQVVQLVDSRAFRHQALQVITKGSGDGSSEPAFPGTLQAARVSRVTARSRTHGITENGHLGG